jgi:hypothetical protein
LMTKRQDLCLQGRSRPEQSDQRQPNQAANISHQPRASPDSTSLASRIEFPTMTTARPGRESAPRGIENVNIKQCLSTASRLGHVVVAHVGPVGQGDRSAALAIRFQFASSRNFTRCRSAVHEATFQSESFDCCLGKPAPRFDLLIRSHHCTDNFFGRLRILFGHEVDRADGRTAPNGSVVTSTT